MPDSLTVKMAECHLKVGTPKENYISFEIAGTAENLVANIVIECGPITDEKTYLCANGKKTNLTIESQPKLKNLSPSGSATSALSLTVMPVSI